MKIEEAKNVAAKLERTSGPLASGGRLSLRAKVEGDRIVFEGGKFGSHSLAIDVSTEERVLAHWEGYVEANGLTTAPKVGQRVSFPSASAWRAGGFRVGTVEAVGPKRARIAYVFGHGGKAKTTIPIAKLRF
jgi:hypothetical protein